MIRVVNTAERKMRDKNIDHPGKGADYETRTATYLESYSLVVIKRLCVKARPCERAS